MLKRLDRLLSNLGYCARSAVPRLTRDGIVARADGARLRPDDKVAHAEILFDGAALDPEQLYLALHKPVGYVCSRSELEGASVFELLPARFSQRNPALATVGRLDRETSGLLLLSDDGQFVHTHTSPRTRTPKVYEVTLANELRGDEAALFSSGTFVLPGESDALMPAETERLGERRARMTLYEGRNRQVRRMWEAVGNEVVGLHRVRVGAVALDSIAEGEWRFLNAD